MGRAWRNGLTDVALGAAGIEPFRDHRGQFDPYGNELQLTEMAVIDELAGAGELVKGKMDQVPVAVIRGYPGAGAADTPGAVTLLRDAASDMFSLGTAEARAAGLRDAATLADGTADRVGAEAVDRAVGAEAVDRAVALVRDVVAAGTVISVTGPELRVAPPPGAGPAGLIRLGADVHRLRAALAAEGLASAARFGDADVVLRVGG
jgi:coenzyme F420-0:L-glutamate ligase/coenzyme F420-1:gamma-L-glutamate ligase